MDPRTAAFSPRRAAIRTSPETSRGGSTTSTPRASCTATAPWRARVTCGTTRWPSREGGLRPSTYRTREGTDIREARGAKERPFFRALFHGRWAFSPETASREYRLTSRFPRKAPSRVSGTGPVRRNARAFAGVRARRRPRARTRRDATASRDASRDRGAAPRSRKGSHPARILLWILPTARRSIVEKSGLLARRSRPIGRSLETPKTDGSAPPSALFFFSLRRQPSQRRRDDDY